jgi:hypothetical protein
MQACLVDETRDRARREGRSLARAARRIALVLGLATIVASSPRPAPAAPQAPEAARETVLRGEVVETGCFVIGGRRGEVHRPCAIACANAGQDLGILDEQTKTLFVVVQDFTGGPQRNPLLDHVATRVEVRGTTLARGGISGVLVRQVKPLTGPARR